MKKMLTNMNLSEEEIQWLNYEIFQYPCPKIQKRLHTVYLKATQTMSNKKIGKLLDLHFNSVSKYIKLYKISGFEGLVATHYHPLKSQLDEHSQSILEDLVTNPFCSVSQAISRIKQLAGIERKPTQVRVFLSRHGFKYRKLSPIPGKVSPEKQNNWLEQILYPAIDKARNAEIELLFCDAAHFTLSCFLCMVWSLTRVFLKTSHGSNRINVFGAVNAVTKEVTTHINTTYVTAQTIIDFMKELKCRYRDKPIALVMDNAKYQRCKLVDDMAKN
jgi:transposase